jgi:hypothetical protein
MKGDEERWAYGFEADDDDEESDARAALCGGCCDAEDEAGAEVDGEDVAGFEVLVCHEHCGEEAVEGVAALSDGEEVGCKLSVPGIYGVNTKR